MVLVGLTGGIATGKSAVSALLRARGIPVVDADAIAHAVEEPGTAEWRAVLETFGWPAIEPSGRINRHWLGRLVFGDAAARERLNAIVHPGVRRRLWDAVEEHRTADAPLVVVDVPLLIENGLYRQVDAVWLVDCDAEQQLARLIKRNGLSEAAARDRIAAQMPLAEKRRYADVVIDNRGTLDQLRGEVERALARVLPAS
jgi:dephospho-CoA kinase